MSDDFGSDVCRYHAMSRFCTSTLALSVLGLAAAWLVTLAAKLDGTLDVTYVTASIPLFLAFGLTCCFVGCSSVTSKIIPQLTCVRR